MRDECPKCGDGMKRSAARLHKGLVRRRCPGCGESDYAWLKLSELKVQLEDATVGQLKAAIQKLSLGAADYRGHGDAREYSPDAQTAVIGELRRVASGSKPGRRERRSRT